VAAMVHCSIHGKFLALALHSLPHLSRTQPLYLLSPPRYQTVLVRHDHWLYHTQAFACPPPRDLDRSLC
jgi:hypothetical protein